MKSRIHPKAKQIIEEAIRSEPRLTRSLKLTSPSTMVAQYRLKTYAEALSNMYSSTDAWKMFSTTNLPGLGTVLGVSSLLAMVTSFAGFLSIERTIEQPRIVQYFANIIGTNLDITGQPTTAFPVVGPTIYSSDNVAMFRESVNSNSFPYTLPPSIIPYPIIPGTLKLTFMVQPTSGPSYSFEVTDDRRGGLLIPSNYLNLFDLTTLPIVDYGQFTPSLSPASINNLVFNGSGVNSVTIVIEANRGYIEEPTFPQVGNDTRLQLDMSRTVMVDTKPSLLTIQMNLSEIAIAQKSMQMDIASYLTQKITEAYTKIINRYIVMTFVRHFLNEPDVTIDVFSPIPPTTPTTPQWYQFTPILDKLVAQMEEVNNALAMKSFVGLKATAYIVSPRMAYWIRRTKILDPSAFVEENAPYINDLIGYWYGVPVLVHSELARYFDTPVPSAGGNQLYNAGGFAVHVRPDATLAPTFHAIFMPPTNTPNVGNFFNPVQQAMALYYQSDCVPLAKELVVPFRVTNLPAA